MNLRKTISATALSLLGLALMLISSGCGGGGSKNVVSSAAGVQFTSPAASPAIDQGQSVSLTVAVNPPGQGVTWSLQTATGKPVGKLTNASATSVTYVAPSSASKTAQVTVVATSVADPSASAALSISIEPAPQITSSSPTPAAIGCPAPGTVIPGLGSSFGTVWTSGVSSLTYYLSAAGGVSPYTWTVTSGTLPNGLTMGTPTSSQTVIYGTPTTPGCSSITLQLADAAGMSVTLPYYLIVLPPPLALQPPPLAIPQAGVPYPPTSLAATNGVAPYFWSLNPNDPLPPGLTFSTPGNSPDAALISGTPTTAGVGLGFSPSLLAYDSQLPYPAVVQASLNITQVEPADPSCHSGSEANLSTSGPYAFLLRGFDSNGPVVITGNFTVDGTGKVTGGSEDINRSTGPQTNLSIVASGSSYTLGADNRGCLTLANSAGTTTTFRFAFGACSTSAASGGCANGGYFTRGHILEDDSSSGIRATGFLRFADTSAFSNSGLSGAYAFGLSGWDGAQGRYAMAGSASAGSGNFLSVAADINDSGAVTPALTGGSGAFTIGSQGRGTGTITVGSSTFGLVFYVVSSSEVILATTDQLDATHPILSGEALSAPGPFGVGPLQNSYMLESSGLSSGAPDVSVGILAFDGSSAVTGTTYENNAGVTTTNSISANYTVDGNTGRLSFTNQTNPHPLVGYVASPASGVGAFLISTDASAQAGKLEYQTTNPPAKFNNSTLTGPSVLGTDENLDSNTWDDVGTVIPNGNGTLGEWFSDLDGPGVMGFLPNQQFLASYSVGKNGVGFFGGQSVSITNGTTTFWIDESPLNLHPAISVMEQ